VAFTSIATAGGWATTAVQAAYDTYFNWALRAGVVFEPLVDFQPQQPTSKGSSITVQLNQYHTAADVVAATTPLGEETDVTPVKLPQTATVTFTPQEYGFANQSTLYLNNRALTSLNPVVAKAVAQHCYETIDYLVQTAARAGTQVKRANGRASTATVVAGDNQHATDIRKAVTLLRANSARTRDGQNFVGLLHPNVIHDLREETGSGSWRVPNEYGVSQDRIWNGEFGQFEGVRFISTPTMLRTTDNDGGAAINVYRGFILGQEALGKAVVNAPEMVDSPVTDKLRRFVGLGWKADLAYKVYRDAALVRLEAASSLG
jgi:N4-gp56 family major capsid protein